MQRFQVQDEYLGYIGEHSAAKVERWINHGGDLSGFYGYLFSGDYLSAACVASGMNFTGFAVLLRMLAQTAPNECYGSPEAVASWRGLLHGTGD